MKIVCCIPLLPVKKINLDIFTQMYLYHKKKKLLKYVTRESNFSIQLGVYSNEPKSS